MSGGTRLESRGDFTIDRRVIPIALIAVPLGVVSTGAAVVLLDLIQLFTQLFFYGRLSLAEGTPAEVPRGPVTFLAPVLGALIVGLMARYGSERIRGHGIPEAIEAILLRGSRVEPKLAVLKPVSAAIAIGSGGPFGAEGPIIMTGGAVGSILAQTFHLTAAERKTLLVSGAAAGMSAVFDAPLAAVLLALELLLFEFKPRSAIPVALASGTAAVARHYVLGSGPIFPVAAQPHPLGFTAAAACVGVGVVAGLASGALTRGVYFAEDTFQRLPVHWMWWPAIAGLVVGLGGLVEPRALGVGYANISDLLDGRLVGAAALTLVVVKATIWIASLGSGTSGGVLAPLLTIGAALGALEAGVLPDLGSGFWPLISMGAILGGTMRVPMTAVIFALELTHDLDALLPLLLAVTAAYLLTTLAFKRSILTEKIVRRGFHLSREYALDPLEILFVREVMRAPPDGAAPATEEAVAWEDEVLREVVYRMAESGRIELLVLAPGEERRVVGLVTLQDLLKARLRHLEEERRRERVIELRPAWLRGDSS